MSITPRTANGVDFDTSIYYFEFLLFTVTIRADAHRRAQFVALLSMHSELTLRLIAPSSTGRSILAIIDCPAVGSLAV